MARNNQSSENEDKELCDQIKEYAQRAYDAATNPENLGNNAQGAFVGVLLEQVVEAVKHTIENPPDFPA